MNRRDLIHWAAALAASAGAAGARSAVASEATADSAAADRDDGAARAAFADFIAALQRSAELVEKLTAGKPVLDRLEGYRAISRMAALGFDRSLEYADPAAPALFRLQSPIRKYLGDAPDQLYHTASIDAGHRYRLRGRLRDERSRTLLFEATVYGGNIDFNGSGSRRLVSHVDERQLKTDAQGSFEILLARENDGAVNFLPLSADAHKLTVRRYFAAPQVNDPLPMTIERIDGAPPARPLESQSLASGLRRTGAFVEETLRFWSKWVPAVEARGINQLSPMPDAGDILSPAGVRYVDGAWRLEPDEALRIAFTPPEVPYWSFVPMNMWSESLDWTRARVCINSLQAKPEKNGEVTLVLSERDPGHPNWVRILGHRSGTMSIRFARMRVGDALPQVRAEVVKT